MYIPSLTKKYLEEGLFYTNFTLTGDRLLGDQLVLNLFELIWSVKSKSSVQNIHLLKFNSNYSSVYLEK